MKTLYLECGMGAAGDMLMAALLELIPDRQAFIDKMNALNLPGVRVEAEKAVKCGITGTHMKVTVNGEEEESADAHDHHHAHDHAHHHGHEDAHEHHHHHEDEHEHHHDHDHDHEHHHDHDHDHEHEHHHHHHDHDHEGHHHADEIFTSWGIETPHKYTKEGIEEILKTFIDSEEYGEVLRAKGMVPAEDGTWIYFDMVPGDYEIREGAPEYAGRLCVIGTELDEAGLAKLFNV